MKPFNGPIPRLPRLLRTKVATLGALGAVAASAFAGSAAADASPRQSAPAVPKPSVVLVHGAWGDSANWNGVIRRLQHDGYTVYAPPNPLQGIPDDSAYLRDFLDTISGPIVLVGHSYGGAVITNAATGDAQVKALVYVDGFEPAANETIGQLVTAQPGTCVVPANLSLVPYPGAPTGAADAYVKQSVFGSCMANGLNPTVTGELAATQHPLTTLALGQESGTPAWLTVPSWAVIGTADHAIPPAELEYMAKRAHSRVTVIPHAPHLSMVSNPGAVTETILDAAHAAS
ncbi:alpha/beta hydrolase [Acidiferrimicrobium sp. IK]|uniref:alpha/beta fold hydrolase n=1 Tax=Acidiferrimicrobium sp. IK TaxID=2871700 RepID=UPI0021CB91AE|nr:alpha/beta hydrolase [Acidiferrimicrobium sp. IK]MCU4187200.1 alpha/beta hydrolase [Acidiferrimicrobium sp. IK]